MITDREIELLHDVGYKIKSDKKNMNKHNHCECGHKLKYCKQCNIVYCEKCNKEWIEKYFPSIFIGTNISPCTTDTVGDFPDTTPTVICKNKHHE